MTNQEDTWQPCQSYNANKIPDVDKEFMEDIFWYKRYEDKPGIWNKVAYYFLKFVGI